MYCVAYGYYQVIIRFTQVMTTFWPDVAHGVCAEWRKPYSHADSESREAVRIARAGKPCYTARRAKAFAKAGDKRRTCYTARRAKAFAKEE